MNYWFLQILVKMNIGNIKEFLQIGNFFIHSPLSTFKIGFTKKVKNSIVARVLGDSGKRIWQKWKLCALLISNVNIVVIDDVKNRKESMKFLKLLSNQFKS